jgi:hypothetical protein
MSPRAVWCWVQEAGHRAMEHFKEELAAITSLCSEFTDDMRDEKV